MFKLIIIGIIAGFVSGLFSAGGGLIVVPALVHVFDMEDAESRATTIFAILPMVIVSGLFYYNSDFIDWGLGLKVALGGIVRWIFGSETPWKVAGICAGDCVYRVFGVCGL